MSGANGWLECGPRGHEDVGQSDASSVVPGNRYGPGAVMWIVLARMARRYDHVTVDDRSRGVVGDVKMAVLAILTWGTAGRAPYHAGKDV